MKWTTYDFENPDNDEIMHTKPQFITYLTYAD